MSKVLISEDDIKKAIDEKLHELDILHNKLKLEIIEYKTATTNYLTKYNYTVNNVKKLQQMYKELVNLINGNS